MKTPQLKISDIRPEDYLNSPGFILDFKSQLEFDALKANIKWNDFNYSNFTSIKVSLKNVLSNLKPEQLRLFLYFVDLPEKQIKGLPLEDLIIKRTVQKVIIKNYFKPSSHDYT
ncbi:MAG: hypothetical protein N3F09_06590 [Bacteroidia bacterium]|nr:hypothetical protein [Bacteroidia bacterium]